MKRSLTLPVAVTQPVWGACRSLFIALSVLLFGSGIQAQNLPPAKVTDTIAADTIITIEEKLVQLALEGPRYKVAEHKNKIDEYQLKKVKSSWLNLLSVSMNYNDQTFNKSAATTIVYPKYFGGITVPLGIIFSSGTEVKSARESVKASKMVQSQLAREIKAEVLSKFAQYKTYGELLAIQNKVLDDEEAAIKVAEKNFRDGTIAIELYNAASKNLNAEQAKRLNLKLQQDLMKIQIEEMIGTDLEPLLKIYPAKQ